MTGQRRPFREQPSENFPKQIQEQRRELSFGRLADSFILHDLVQHVCDKEHGGATYWLGPLVKGYCCTQNIQLNSERAEGYGIEPFKRDHCLLQANL